MRVASRATRRNRRHEQFLNSPISKSLTIGPAAFKH